MQGDSWSSSDIQQYVERGLSPCRKASEPLEPCWWMEGDTPECHPDCEDPLWLWEKRWGSKSATACVLSYVR